MDIGFKHVYVRFPVIRSGRFAEQINWSNLMDGSICYRRNRRALNRFYYFGTEMVWRVTGAEPLIDPSIAAQKSVPSPATWGHRPAEVVGFLLAPASASNAARRLGCSLLKVFGQLPGD